MHKFVPCNKKEPPLSWWEGRYKQDLKRRDLLLSRCKRWQQLRNAQHISGGLFEKLAPIHSIPGAALDPQQISSFLEPGRFLDIPTHASPFCHDMCTFKANAENVRRLFDMWPPLQKWCTQAESEKAQNFMGTHLYICKKYMQRSRLLCTTLS